MGNEIKKIIKVVSPGKEYLDDFVGKFANNMANGVAAHLARLEREYGEAFCRILMGQFLSQVILNEVFKQLTDRPEKHEEMSNAELVKYNTRKFAEAKLDLSEAVASGVALAMSRYSGQNIEYACTIKMVGEPKNRKLC